MMRFNKARQELLCKNNVTDAAFVAGFNHLGRFAEQYRIMFGELPSVTGQR